MTERTPERSATDRRWLAAAALVALAAVVARIHNAFAYPPLFDFDGPGHALGAFAFYEGRLPHPRSWSGFHPPLYYALGALVWRILPESIPVHAGLRLLSAAAGAAAVAVTWRVLARRVPAADAAVVSALALCVPVMAISTSMLGNETLGALFATAVLARLIAVPADPRRAVRHSFGTALLAGLAGLSKSTGLAVIAVALFHYAWHLRRDLRSAALAVGIAGGVALLVAGPFYGRTVLEGGSLFVVVSGGALSDQLGNEMEVQPPGERRLSDYALLPAATFFAPVFQAPGMTRSIPGLLYASTWADGHAQFLPPSVPAVIRAESALALLGLLPSALALFGLIQIVRRGELEAQAGPCLIAAVLLAALLRYTWVLPYYSAVKASYLLPALLPAALALAAGLAHFRGGSRFALRAALLGIAALATAVTTYGWWL